MIFKPLKLLAMRPQWIEPISMKKLGYELISDKDGYLEYGNKAGLKFPDYGIASANKRIITFSTVYSDNAVFMGIREDGDTRTVFLGVVDTEVAMKLIIEACR